MRKNIKTRIGAVLLCVVMLTGQVQYPVTIYAKNNSTSYGDGLCEHHTEHDEDCGYAEGSPCTHIHTDECYVMVETCSHVHTSSCYADSDDEDEDTATSSNAKDREPIECSHVCSEEEGCATRKLDCHHEHDETCGYVEGTQCSYVCEICQEDGELTDATPSDATSLNAALSGGASGTVSGNAIQKSESTEKIITAWNWAGSADELEIQQDEETGAWGLGLPGVNVDNQADFDTIVSMLPTAIKATVSGTAITTATESDATVSDAAEADDVEFVLINDLDIASSSDADQTEELTITWNCDTFVKDETGNWPVSGNYIFKAELPKGYSLSSDTKKLEVTVQFGEAGVYLTLDSDGYYLISSADDLIEFASLVNGGQTKINARLTYDIDMSGKTWTPIGTWSNGYAGNFNGNGFTIKNITFSGDYDIGLFGGINNATISNLGITGAFSGKQNIGSIAGYVCSNSKNTIQNCWSEMTITGTDSDTRAGGIVGNSEFGSCNISNCIYIGKLQGNANYGAIYGYKKNSSNATNNYYLNTASDKEGYGTISKTAEQFQSGEVAWLLNNSTSDGVWKQSLGTDNYPSFSGGTVYQNADGTYSNTDNRKTQTAPLALNATVTSNSITIDTQLSTVGTKTQYACMDENVVPSDDNWQDSNIFGSRSAGTPYTCYIRFAGNASYFASEAVSEVFTTNVDNVSYMDATVSADGKVTMSEKTVNNCIVLRQQKTLTSGWYVVNSEVTFDTQNRPTVTGDVHLILADGGKLTVPGGITVNNQPDSLTIYGQSGDTGTLIAGEATTTNRSGIGGGDGQGGGNITINGGKVTAIGGTYGAGIGSGHMHNNFSTTTAVITINGGEVTASVKPITNLIPPNVTYYEVEAAGIGGGNRGSSGIITINGGTVNATGGRRAAAIGSGRYGNVDTITINGGTITANTSGGNGVSIGRGNTENAPTGGTIFISSSATITLKDLANQSPLYNVIETTSGVVYTDKNGIFNGDELITDLTVPAGYTLTVPEGSTLAIPSGMTLTNNGTIKNSGTITKAGTLTNNGTLSYPVTLAVAAGDDGITGFETSKNGTDYVTPDSPLMADYGTDLYVKAILADNRVFGQWTGGSTDAVYQISADNYNPVSLTASSSAISYTITIPSNVTAGGEEVSITASNLNLGTGGAVHVKANYGTDYDISSAGLLTLKRKDATDTITSQMYIGGNEFKDLTKDVAVFSNSSNVPVSVKFGTPSHEGTIPAGDYSGTVTFQIYIQ